MAFPLLLLLATDDTASDAVKRVTYRHNAEKVVDDGFHDCASALLMSNPTKAAHHCTSKIGAILLLSACVNCIIHHVEHQEREIQKAIVRYIRLKYPQLLVIHVPNGGKHGVRYGSILKAMGVVAGCSDLIVIADGWMTFMEVKTPKGVQSPAQKDFASSVERLGYGYCVVRSIDDAEQYIRSRNV